TETLAGAPQLVRRYQQATEEQQAILHAAIDARRVGIQAPVPANLLCDAARGYLTAVHPDESWFPPALAELASHDRRHAKVTAPLILIPAPERRTGLGYTVADYLLQLLTPQRRTKPLPDITWKALINHPHGTEDLVRLADSSDNRMLYHVSMPLYRALVD